MSATAKPQRRPLILRQIKPVPANSSPDPISTYVSVYFAAFSSDPVSTHGFPRTQVVRDWFEAMVREEVRDESAVHFEMVEEAGEGPDATGNEEVVAFAKWNLPKPSAGKGKDKEDAEQEQGEEAELPEWPKEETADTALLSEFFSKLASKKKSIMGDGRDGKGYYYLEMVATLPAHQGRGAASRILQWGVDAADREGVDCYLEASPVAVSLYRKFGFVEVDRVVVDVDGYGPFENLCMVRKPKV